MVFFDSSFSKTSTFELLLFPSYWQLLIRFSFFMGGDSNLVTFSIFIYMQFLHGFLIVNRFWGVLRLLTEIVHPIIMAYFHDQGELTSYLSHRTTGENV